jgi:hypothetical protein
MCTPKLLENGKTDGSIGFRGTAVRRPSYMMAPVERLGRPWDQRLGGGAAKHEIG